MAFDRAHKVDLTAAWVATDGSGAEFEKVWPKLREMLRREGIQGEVAIRRERAAMQARGVF